MVSENKSDGVVGSYWREAYSNRMRKWRWIGHIMRKEDEFIEEKAGLEFAGSPKECKNAAKPERTVFE
jgi:hypothetical protein